MKARKITPRRIKPTRRITPTRITRRIRPTRWITPMRTSPKRRIMPTRRIMPMRRITPTKRKTSRIMQPRYTRSLIMVHHFHLRVFILSDAYNAPILHLTPRIFFEG